MLLEGIVFGLPAIQRKVTVKTSDAIIVFRTRVVAPASCDHLLGLTLPALAAFMRPTVVECSFPRVYETFTHGVLAQLLTAGQRTGDGGTDRPSTVGGMSKVFGEWVVAGLPAIEVGIADKAGRVIEAVGRRLVVESSLSELSRHHQHSQLPSDEQETLPVRRLERRAAMSPHCLLPSS